MTETNDHALAQEAGVPRAGAAPTATDEAAADTVADNLVVTALEKATDAEEPELEPRHIGEVTAADESAAGNAAGAEHPADSEPGTKTIAAVESGDEGEADTKPEAETAPDTEIAPAVESTVESTAGSEVDADPEVEVEVTPATEVGTVPEATLAVGIETEPEIEAKSGIEEEPAAGTVPTPGAEAARDGEDIESANAGAPAIEAEAEPAPEIPMAPSAVPFAAALEAGNPVEGKVIGWNKGGFHVASGGVATFCPRSLMELGNRPGPPAHYVNNTYEFHVLEIKEAGRRIVLTRRPAIRSERRRVLDDLRARQESREPVSGTVTSVTDFGAFVDLGGGMGGLVHRSQISRTQAGEPADLVKVGQRIEALVTKVEKKRGKRGGRISLSMKALEADPWKETAKGLTAGDKFRGKVVRHCEFGLFVELVPGLDGLVHTSQLPIGKSMRAPEFAVGEEIEGWIVEVAPRRRRLALTLREAPASDPWQDLGEQYAEGAEVEGRVEQVSRHGVFVELEPGLVGLLPMSAITLPEGNQAQRAYPPGRGVKVVIESIDRKRRRLGLAPPGSRLVGTKSDYKHYRKRQKQSTGLNAMASAFARLRQTR